MSQKGRDRRETFLGLIAPIGIDLDMVVRALDQAFRSIGYQSNPIRLTDFLLERKEMFKLEYKGEFDRYRKFIAAGDLACEKFKRRDLFSLYGIARVWQNFPDRQADIPKKVVHIFRQFKRTEELDTMRETYGSNIIFVGCHAPRKNRVAKLISKILSSERGLDRNTLESEALRIIGIDENEKDNPNGQRVLDCYAHADFILDCSTQASLEESTNRLVECFFGAPFVSPTRDEYCSYVAKSAAFRSTDLSRQVGAAIFGEKCEVISLGCNEVPAPGGGTYWTDHEHDARDFRLGQDSNQKVKTDMMRDLLVRLQKAGWLNDSKAHLSPEDIVTQAIKKSETSQSGPLAAAMINDVIEYGRMLHAEMNALMDAARFRRTTEGSTLYCTTMPCHLCTKLIIAAGIKRVVYLEPYFKSLVSELYDDSVSMNETVDQSKVIFEPLKGVTPNGFTTVFGKGKRKEANGSAIQWDRQNAEPIFTTNIPFYLPLEQKMMGDLKVAVATPKPPKARSSRAAKSAGQPPAKRQTRKPSSS